MKIICDSCGAIYRIPEQKLTREVSRATCKKCGTKIIIRRTKATEEGLDDLRVASSESSMDEDGVINHEERTVIAQVPELQNFDATPPLSTGSVSNEEQLRSVLGGGGYPDPEETPTPVPESAREEDELTQATVHPVVRTLERSTSPSLETPVPAVPPHAQLPEAPPVPAARPVQEHEAAPPPTPPAPSITADTAPARPSGARVLASSQPPPPPTVPSAVGHKRTDVVDIFSRQPEPGASAAEFHQPIHRVSMILLAFACLGVLAFMHQGLWGLTLVTAVGFFVALYCILAALLAQFDLSSRRSINYARVFSIPAVACALLLAVLMWLQSDNLAFLHPEYDPDLVKIAIKWLPDAPEAVQKGSLEDKVKEFTRSKTRKARNPRRPKPTPKEPARPTPTQAPGKPKFEDPALAALLETRDRPGAVPHTRKTEQEVTLDKAGIDSALDRARVVTCFVTDAAGLNVSGRIEFKLLLRPDGTVKQALISSPAELSGTRLEDCLEKKARLARFPEFQGDQALWHERVFHGN